MAATEKGVWGLQDVRDKQLQDEWEYNGDPFENGGQLWALGGDNTYGGLGLNNTNPESSPKQVGTDTNWNQGQQGDNAASYLTGFIKKDGTLWTWGRNAFGGLGQNNTTNYSSPKQVPGSYVIFAESQPETSMAIKTDGTLWMWGHNAGGTLGQNNTTPYSSPVQVPGSYPTNSGWKDDLATRQISKGYVKSAAIKTDGTLWMWGDGDSGGLGQNNTTQYSSPRQVGTETTWKSVSCGFFTVATKTDGTLWAWGENNNGQLGQNNTTEYSSPRQVGSGTTWTKIFANRYNMNAFKSDGSLWVWGANTGQGNGLSLPDSAARSSPVQLPGAWDAYSVGDDGSRTATKTDGTLWAWGCNAEGRFGVNDRTNRSSPTQVGTVSKWDGKTHCGRGAMYSLQKALTPSQL